MLIKATFQYNQQLFITQKIKKRKYLVACSGKIKQVSSPFTYYNCFKSCRKGAREEKRREGSNQSI